MDNDKENTFSSASPSRNRRRRSSILKDSPGRKVLENTSVSQQRRSSKRVSFADTKTIKEFLATKGNLTEWNSTYETSASCDTSNSMDMTCCPDKSIMLDTGDGLDNYDGSPALETNFEKIEDIEDPTSLDTTCDSPNFLREFLSLGPSKSSKSSEENPQESEDDAISATTNFLNSFISIKPSVAPESPICAPAARVRTDSEEGLDIYSDQTEQLMQDDIARMMTADFANTWLSQSNAKAPLKSTADPFLHVTKDPVNQPLDNKMIATSSSQIAKYSLANATPVLPAEIGMIIASNQIEKVHRNEPTQKLGTDKEITCPSDYVSKIMKGDHAQKFIEDMVMTCATDNISKLMQNDQTQKLSADMEITCAMGNIAKLKQNDQTQKLSADMEMTCATGNIAKLMQNDQTQKLSADMEMTCATGNIAKLMKNDQTQKLSADMEITCAMGNIANLQNDQTHKLSADMEMTCATGNIAKLMKNDQNQKLYADMAMTCATGNVAKQMQNDQTQKLTVDMEMTHAMGNVAGLLHQLHSSEVCSNAAVSDTETGSAEKLSADKVTACHSSDTKQRPGSNLKEASNPNINQLNRCGITRMFSTLDLQQNPQEKQMSALLDTVADSTNLGQIAELGRTKAGTIASHSFSQASKLPGNEVSNRKSVGLNVTCPANEPTEAVADNRQERKSMYARVTYSMNHEGENRAMEYAGVRISDCENQNVEEICAEEPHLGNALPLKTGQNSSHRRMSSMGFVSFTDKTSDLSQQILQSFSSDSVACSNKSKIVDVQGKISDIDKEERLLSPTFLQNQKIDKDSEGTFKSERLPSPNAQIKRKHDGKEDSDSTLKIHAGEDRSLYRAFQSDANIPTANSVCNSTSVNDQGEVFPNSEQADQLISAFINNEVSPAKTNSTPSVSCDGNSKTLLIKNSKIEDSLSEECLEDIYMDMDNSANISLEYSSGENVCVSPVADASVNKSLLELVVNDALSSLPTEVETFKKRFSEIQEGHADFEKTLEEGTHKHNVRKKIIASATMSVLQLSQSIQNMSAEVLENTCTQETNLSKSESTKETEECFQSILHDADSGNAEASQLAPPSQHISGTDGSMETQHNVNLELKGTQETGEYTPAEVTSAVSSNLQDSQKIDQIGLQAEEIQRSNQSFNSTISSFGVIVESSMKQKFCKPCESVDLQGEFFFDSSNFTSRWMLKEVSKGVRVLTLQHTPLEIMLNVTHTDDHWTVTTATWKPQAKDLKNNDSRLVMKTLGCRIAAAMLELYGLALCEVGEALDKVAAAYEDVSTLLLEFQVIKTAYLTEFHVNSVNITLFNSHRHICVTVLIQITPPAPSPENPCTLQASAKVTVGNITNKTVEEAMAGVIPGPKKILRMVRAADLVVQGKM